MNNIDKNKKYTESKKVQTQEIIDLKIENQVMRKQFLIMRDMIDNILDDLESREELIVKYVKKHYAGLENLKRCINCLKIGNWNESFCSNCLSTGEKNRDVAKQETRVKSLEVKPEELVQNNDLDKTKVVENEKPKNSQEDQSASKNNKEQKELERNEL